jgi:hypothetical protein
MVSKLVASVVGELVASMNGAPLDRWSTIIGASLILIETSQINIYS